NRLPLCTLAYQNFAVVGVANDRRRGAITLCIFDNLWLAAIQHRYTRVGGTQINSNYLTHVVCLQFSVSLLSILAQFDLFQGPACVIY
ncbi:UNVERIFIED_CONTAM: hypothetical protein GTU68_047300, partial [Idotea baltica]|nr:hypothetical protein [Idotea baltica]